MEHRKNKVKKLLIEILIDLGMASFYVDQWFGRTMALLETWITLVAWLPHTHNSFDSGCQMTYFHRFIRILHLKLLSLSVLVSIYIILHCSSQTLSNKFKNIVCYLFYSNGTRSVRYKNGNVSVETEGLTREGVPDEVEVSQQHNTLQQPHLGNTYVRSDIWQAPYQSCC